MHLPNGSQIFVESSRSAEIPFSDITNNAGSPVLTMTTANASKVKAGQYVLFTASSWGKLLNQQLRVKNVTDTSVTVESFDTSDLNQFPAGASGSIVVINSWVEIPCVQDLAQDGNEQQYYNYQCLSDDREQQLPTYKSAVSITYTFAHEFDNPIYPTLRKADETGEVKALRMYVPRASEMRLYSAVLSFNDIPATTMNEMETVSLAAALKGRFVSVTAEGA